MTGDLRRDDLALLQRVARRKGWAVLLRSSGDGRCHSERPPSRLTCLDVVELGVGHTRRRQILAGNLQARVILESPRHVQLAAATILETLTKRGVFDLGDLEAAS